MSKRTERLLRNVKGFSRGIRTTKPSSSDLKDGEEVYVKTSNTLYLYTKQNGIMWYVEFTKA